MSGFASSGPSGRGGQQVAHLVARIAVVAVALSLGACAQGNDFNLGLLQDEPQVADIATASTGPAGLAELEKATQFWAKKNAENPRDGEAAIAYAKNLKALGRKKMAFSVLQAGYMFNSNNREYLSEYGRLALENGQVTTADQLLARADEPGKPDWRIISARGTVHAKQGRYKEAAEFFERARALQPGQASILNNLAMAYTMNGEAERGERLLRQAMAAGSADEKVKKNLVLVLELQGKKAEAQRVANGEPMEVASASAAGMPQLRPSHAAYSAGVDAQPLPHATAAAASSMDADAIIRAAMEADAARQR